MSASATLKAESQNHANDKAKKKAPKKSVKRAFGGPFAYRLTETKFKG
jgi:hypothetical protein